MTSKALVSVLGLGLAASSAWAQVSASSVSVAVGDTEKVSVGYAHGLNCDDLAVASVTLASGKIANQLVVTGKKPGQTTCRAGTGQGGPTVTITITVTEKGSGAKSPPPSPPAD